mmetsp:Transcript_70495/g.106620  ORF Transcript_70495/g.106620 Transcript_70495/m.106620 type:complete len:227 (-) Transcript_70495:2603-3283(-)
MRTDTNRKTARMSSDYLNAAPGTLHSFAWRKPQPSQLLDGLYGLLISDTSARLLLTPNVQQKTPLPLPLLDNGNPFLDPTDTITDDFGDGALYFASHMVSIATYIYNAISLQYDVCKPVRAARRRLHHILHISMGPPVSRERSMKIRNDAFTLQTLHLVGVQPIMVRVTTAKVYIHFSDLLAAAIFSSDQQPVCIFLPYGEILSFEFVSSSPRPLYNCIRCFCGFF